jgi:hypothetical protein
MLKFLEKSMDESFIGEVKIMTGSICITKISRQYGKFFADTAHLPGT